MLSSELSTFCIGQLTLLLISGLILSKNSYHGGPFSCEISSTFSALSHLATSRKTRGGLKWMLLKFFQIRKNSASVFLLNLTCEYRLGTLILSSDLLSSSLLLISGALSLCRRCSETLNLILALRRIISVILNTVLGRCLGKGKVKWVFVICVFVTKLLHIARVKGNTWVLLTII